MLQRISLTYSPFGWVLLPVIVIISENFVSHSPLAGDLQTSPNILHGLITLVNQKKVLSFATTLIHHCITHSVQVSPSGRTLSIAGTNTLAGSCGTLLGAFHSLIHRFRVPLGDAVAMLSENPARYNCGYCRIGAMLSSCLKIQN